MGQAGYLGRIAAAAAIVAADIGGADMASYDKPPSPRYAVTASPKPGLDGRGGDIRRRLRETVRIMAEGGQEEGHPLSRDRHVSIPVQGPGNGEIYLSFISDGNTVIDCGDALESSFPFGAGGGYVTYVDKCVDGVDAPKRLTRSDDSVHLNGKRVGGRRHPLWKEYGRFIDRALEALKRRANSRELEELRKMLTKPETRYFPR